jgi:Plasmid pRiA4b ORF-3-like protein
MAEPLLKLGKGASFFVKSQLRRLRQEDDTWEADFFPIPCSDSEHDSVWWGIVLSQSHENVLAQQTVEDPPTINDLARLLAEAMRRPLVDFSSRPRCLYLRNRPEWAELLPHLKQIGIQVVSQEALPKWDRAFGDLCAEVEQARTVQEVGPAKEAPIRRGRKVVKPRKPPQKSLATPKQGGVRLYTLDVFLPKRPVSKSFAKKKSGVSRLIQIRGDQTLEDLHHAIFAAFDREEEHMYEFQFGQGPRDYQGPIYGLQEGGHVRKTTIDSLRLKVGRSFGYLFDFGDNWQHQINVEVIEDKMPQGQYPKVLKRVGESPPQYVDEDE